MVVSEATEPTDADPDNLISMLALGAFAGLILGIGVAALLEAVRPTIVGGDAISRELDALPGDIIFPVLHGRWGEGGPLQELLEEIGRPYVGSAPGPASMAMDKMTTKELLAREGVRTPRAVEFRVTSFKLPQPKNQLYFVLFACLSPPTVDR